jgi:hypothetical protein
MTIIEHQQKNLPIHEGDDYEFFFLEKEREYFHSDSGRKARSELFKDMKMSVSPSDTQELKHFLRNQREVLKKEFEKQESYVIWRKSFDDERQDFCISTFIHKLHILNDGQISSNEWESFMKFYCMTKQIDKILRILLENEERTHGDTVNFYYNNYGEIHFGSAASSEAASADADGLEPLRNDIFDSRLFDTDARLKALRGAIASAIDLGYASAIYGGTPQEIRINPRVLNEWYYLRKAMDEAYVFKGKTTDTRFIDQMISWFPMLAECDSSEELKKFKRRLAKAVSDERSRWRIVKTGKIVSLRQMWAKRKHVRIDDSARMERIQKIALDGLYKRLMDLKQNIEKEKSTQQS